MIQDGEKQVLDRCNGLALRNIVKDFVEFNRLDERRSGSKITFEMSMIKNKLYSVVAGDDLVNKMCDFITNSLNEQFDLTVDEIDELVRTNNLCLILS